MRDDFGNSHNKLKESNTALIKNHDNLINKVNKLKKKLEKTIEANQNITETHSNEILKQMEEKFKLQNESKQELSKTFITISIS